jgi:hypothetical protein
MEYDVVVIGGGSAGISSAIQAAKAGSRTLLVEKNGLLGGTITSGGVNFPGLFHAWGKQVIAGIGWDLVKRTAALEGNELPDFQNYQRGHWMLQVRVNGPMFAALADEAALAAGVELLFHTMLARVSRTNESWQLVLCTKEGLRNLSTTVLIDCSGDANVAGLAGLSRLRNQALQPGTLIFRLGGYQPESLDFPTLQKAAEKAIHENRLLPTDISSSQFSIEAFLRNFGENAMHIPDIDGSTSLGRTQAEIRGRQALLRIYRFLKPLPGLENLRVETCAPEIGIRETFTIEGKTTIEVQDYLSGRKWEDAVCYSYYPIDVHLSEGIGIDLRPLKEDSVPTIPRRAMLPLGSRNFLAAGRCISSDQEANSALRTQATCMATGQAAGALAALACQLNCDVEEVPLNLLFDLLSEHGAILPGDVKF